MSGGRRLGAGGGDAEGGCGGMIGAARSLKGGSDSKSQLKLSRKPSRSVVSEGENRSAEGGKEGGNKLESAGSKTYSKSAKGTGG